MRRIKMPYRFNSAIHAAFSSAAPQWRDFTMRRCTGPRGKLLFRLFSPFVSRPSPARRPRAIPAGASSIFSSSLILSVVKLFFSLSMKSQHLPASAIKSSVSHLSTSLIRPASLPRRRPCTRLPIKRKSPTYGRSHWPTFGELFWRNGGSPHRAA